MGLQFHRIRSTTQYEAETLSLIDKVIKPFVSRKKKELKLPLTPNALLIWDVFNGQKMGKVERLVKAGISEYRGFMCLYPLKAAKYEIQRPSTCRATLFRCKFWSMCPVFHLA